MQSPPAAAGLRQRTPRSSPASEEKREGPRIERGRSRLAASGSASPRSTPSSSTSSSSSSSSSSDSSRSRSPAPPRPAPPAAAAPSTSSSAAPPTLSVTSTEAMITLASDVAQFGPLRTGVGTLKRVFDGVVQSADLGGCSMVVKILLGLLSTVVLVAASLPSTLPWLTPRIYATQQAADFQRQLERPLLDAAFSLQRLIFRTATENYIDDMLCLGRDVDEDQAAIGMLYVFASFIAHAKAVLTHPHADFGALGGTLGTRDYTRASSVVAGLQAAIAALGHFGDPNCRPPADRAKCDAHFLVHTTQRRAIAELMRRSPVVPAGVVGTALPPETVMPFFEFAALFHPIVANLLALRDPFTPANNDTAPPVYPNQTSLTYWLTPLLRDILALRDKEFFCKHPERLVNLQNALANLVKTLDGGHGVYVTATEDSVTVLESIATWVLTNILPTDPRANHDRHPYGAHSSASNGRRGTSGELGLLLDDQRAIDAQSNAMRPRVRLLSRFEFLCTRERDKGGFRFTL